MNKKVIVKTLLIICVVYAACTKQTTPENHIVQPMLQRSEDYFTNLRAYKKSDHAIFFGWFGGTGSAGDSVIPGVMDRIPDSVDVVALWGGVPPLGSYNFNLMQKLRSQKGTKFLITLFGSGVDALIRKNDSVLFFTKKDTMSAIKNVAKAITDTLSKYQLDGFDLDYEPREAAEINSIFGYNSNVGGRNAYTKALFKSLSQYLGPQSGTEKLLIIDGYSEYGIANYFNYFMQQSYGVSSPQNLSSRLSTYGLGECPPNKFVPCENFESYWSTGGVNFNDPKRGTIPSLIGFAYWNPTQGRKGGCGAYHAEYEYGSNPDYEYCRRAIQIMNPAAQ